MDIDWNLLARYLAGRVSLHERRNVEKWCEADPSRGLFLEELAEIWETSEEPRTSLAVDPLELDAHWD